MCASHIKATQQNKAFPQPHPEVWLLCHFNWPMVVEWDLYLLLAWGLCLLSLVEAK